VARAFPSTYLPEEAARGVQGSAQLLSAACFKASGSMSRRTGAEVLVFANRRGAAAGGDFRSAEEGNPILATCDDDDLSGDLFDYLLPPCCSEGKGDTA